MSKKKIILIIVLIIGISLSVRFFTADAMLVSYRIPEEQGKNYLNITEEILEKHPKIQESLSQADKKLPLKTNSQDYDYRGASQFPLSLIISNYEARGILVTFEGLSYESNSFFMFEKFYLVNDDKYYDYGIMICFITCGSNY